MGRSHQSESASTCDLTRTRSSRHWPRKGKHWSRWRACGGTGAGGSATTATSIVGASLDTTTDILTVTETGGAFFTLQLSGSYAPDTFVNWHSDGTGGTNLFLSAQKEFDSQGTNDSWLDPVAWSGTDDSSGIYSYNIYVSTDGEPFRIWLTNSPLTGAIYSGRSGSRYGSQ